jgi:hypothetical protein
MMEANMTDVAESAGTETTATTATTATTENFVGYSVEELLRDFGLGFNE